MLASRGPLPVLLISALLIHLQAPPATLARQAPTSQGQVRALARLKPRDGLVMVGVRPGQRIIELKIAEDDTVQPGDELAILEGHEEAQAALELAQAQKKAADEQRALKRDQAAFERKREDSLLKDQLEARQNTYVAISTRLKQEQTTLTQLAADPQASATQRHDLELAINRLQVDSYSAYLALQEARLNQDLLAEGRQLEDRALADDTAEAQLLDRQIDQARLAFEATTLKAPAAGRVLELLVHPGEISAGAILVLGDTSSMVAVAEVDQSNAGRVREGDTAEVSILGRTFPGKVTRVGRIVGTNRLQDVDPRAPRDLRVIRVTIALDVSAVAADYVNMEVDVAIKPRAATP